MSPKKAVHAAASHLRPRVEGEREQQILDAALEVLAEVGYDRLTMDAVAARAKASKATLYRRWSDKGGLVIDALVALKEPVDPVPDTGSLRDDLLAVFCSPQTMLDQQVAIVGSVLTAICRDPEFASAFREKFIAPKAAITLKIFERAATRGELRDDLDVELVAMALPAMVLHRMFLLGEPPSEQVVTRVVDQIVLPAATRG